MSNKCGPLAVGYCMWILELHAFLIKWTETLAIRHDNYWCCQQVAPAFSAIEAPFKFPTFSQVSFSANFVVWKLHFLSDGGRQIEYRVGHYGTFERCWESCGQLSYWRCPCWTVHRIKWRFWVWRRWWRIPIVKTKPGILQQINNDEGSYWSFEEYDVH